MNVFDEKNMSSSSVDFDQAISKAQSSVAVWEALGAFSKAVVGHKLFTVMTVDIAAGLARRAYTDDPLNYPVSGTKPIHHDQWFDIVHGKKQNFVANTIADIAKVFPDFELIRSLGCGSVVNLPVVLQGELVATINMLDAEHHYTPERVAATETMLTIPSKLCYLLAKQFDTRSGIPD